MQDSNLRPSAPKADALPSCANPGCSYVLYPRLAPLSTGNKVLLGIYHYLTEFQQSDSFFFEQFYYST